jgi:hypothetical protein
MQLAITIGAAGGGAIYDFKGAIAVFGQQCGSVRRRGDGPFRRSDAGR